MALKPFIMFNGIKYSVDKSNGYFRSHGPYVGRHNPKTYLHRDMWIFYRGSIPIDYDVHHKDGNKTHNKISNFECLSDVDHQLLYSAVRKDIPLKNCERCGLEMPRRHPRTGRLDISPYLYSRKRFCSVKCFSIASHGIQRKKGLTPNQVRRIRALCAKGVKRVEIAMTFSISLSLINTIRKRLAHRSVQ